METELTNVPTSNCPICPNGTVNASDGEILSEYSTLPSLTIS